MDIKIILGRSRYVLAVLTLALTPFLTLSATVSAQPVPEYLGVYAVTNGKLVELKPLPGGSQRQFELFGSDVLKNSSGLAFNDPKLYFIIYREGASDLSLFLEVMKIVKYTTADLTSGRLVPVASSWVATKRGFELRIAPLPQNPHMMVRAVPAQPIPSGRYGLTVGQALYDFQFGPATESCIVRIGSLAGADYIDCDAFEKQHPGALAAAQRGASSPTSQPATTPAAPKSQSITPTKSVKGTAVISAGAGTTAAVFDACAQAMREQHYTIVDSDSAAGIIRAERAVSSPFAPASRTQTDGYTWSARIWPAADGSISVEMERGSTRWSAPGDIPRLMTQVMAKAGVAPRNVTLTFDDESMPLDEW